MALLITAAAKITYKSMDHLPDKTDGEHDTQADQRGGGIFS